MLDYKMLYYKMLYYKFRIGSKFPEWSGTKFPECFSGVALRNATPDWRVEWSGGVEWPLRSGTPEWSEWSYFEPCV